MAWLKSKFRRKNRAQADPEPVPEPLDLEEQGPIVPPRGSRRNVGNRIRMAIASFTDYVDGSYRDRQRRREQFRDAFREHILEDHSQSAAILSDILSFLSVDELTQSVFLVSRSFFVAAKGALITRPAFSEEEYEMMLHPHKGVGQDLLFLLVTSVGLDVTRAVTTNAGPLTAFTYACFKAYLKPLANLLHRSHPTNSCLLYAIHKGDTEEGLEVLNLLLEDGRLSADFDHDILLRTAARNGHPMVVERLLQCDTVRPDDFENAAFKGAVESRRPNCARILLEDPRVIASPEELNTVLKWWFPS